MICPNCKKIISKDDKFCGYCGYKLRPEDIEFSAWSRPKESEFLIKSSTEDFDKEEAPLNYASFWIRFGAFVLDYGLIILLALIFGFVSAFFLGITLETESDTVVGFIIIVAYHTLFLSIYSSTPGKLLYGLEVIDEKTRERIKFGKALGRSLSYFLSSILLGLGFWNIAFDKPRHRGWHDKIANTLVIRKKKKSLVWPAILSVIAVCFSTWIIYLGEAGYDFSYLGQEAAILNSIQQKISQQPPGFCCSYVSPLERDYYLEDIPQELLSQEKKNAEQIFEEFSKAVVTIGGETDYGEFGFGSGFLISPSGLIATNFHVIEDMDKLAVALIKEQVQVFDVNLIVAEDHIKDIAVLKIEGQNLPYIVMGNSDLMKTGQKVLAIGNPEGFTNTISEGMISQIRELEEGIKSFQITTPISMGSSGGALFNEMGEIIGITNSIFLWGQNINFAVPINYVRELIGLGQATSWVIPEDSSDLIWCNGRYWVPCLIGEKFHCPEAGEPFCCDGVICNDECWQPCSYGQKFYCPPEGEPYCE